MYYCTISIGLYVDGDKGKFGINHATLKHGKFTKHPGHDHEQQIGTVNEKTFEAGSPNWVDACEREGAAYGTEGSFEVWRSGHNVMKVAWMIPFYSLTNSEGVGIWTNRDKPVLHVEKHMSGHYAIDVDDELEVNGTDRRFRDEHEFFIESVYWPTVWKGNIKVKLLE